MGEEKWMRIRQGVLKAKVVLKTATEKQKHEYEALLRFYGTNWTAGKVCHKVLERTEYKLVKKYSKRVDEVADVLEEIFRVDTEKKP